MDRDVAQTLAALERKLAELERELTHMGRAGADPGEAAALYSHALRGAAGGGEEHATSGLGAAGSSSPRPPAPPPHPGAPSPRVASHPPHAVPPPPAPPHRYPPAGVLVDEAVDQRFSMEAQETVYGEIPATKDERQSIELADLVRFKERMQSTLQGLIDEYSGLLSIEPPQR